MTSSNRLSLLLLPGLTLFLGAAACGGKVEGTAAPDDARLAKASGLVVIDVDAKAVATATFGTNHRTTVSVPTGTCVFADDWKTWGHGTPFGAGRITIDGATEPVVLDTDAAGTYVPWRADRPTIFGGETLHVHATGGAFPPFDAHVEVPPRVTLTHLEPGDDGTLVVDALGLSFDAAPGAPAATLGALFVAPPPSEARILCRARTDQGIFVDPDMLARLGTGTGRYSIMAQSTAAIRVGDGVVTFDASLAAISLGGRPLSGAIRY